MDMPEFLTEEQVSERYAGVISPGTLRNWRHQKIGPNYIHAGKQVLYAVAELIEWERENTVICRRTKNSTNTKPRTEQL